jgi:hypothetical protein
MHKRQPYTPDLATFLRESSKEALDEKLKKALDNPELDAALARVKPKLKPGEDPLFFDVNRLSSPSLTGVTPVDTVAKPGTEHAANDEPAAPDSPWAMSGGGEPELDRDALPSAHLPPAAPPTSVPIPRKAVRAEPRRGLPAWVLSGLSPKLIAGLAVFAVLAPVTVVFVMSRTTTPAESRRGTASSVAAGATAPPSPTGPATTARPAPTGPAATATSPVPGPAVQDGGAAVPAPSSAPTTPRAPAPVKPRATDDPYSSPPSPPATVAPAPPTAAPASTPPTSSPKTPSDIY